MERIFEVKFVIKNEQIMTKMHNNKITPQEAIGLLEMAKVQILDSLKQGRQEVFHTEFKED